MSVTSCLESKFFQQGRGKVFAYIVENHTHIDLQPNYVLNKGHVHYPSTTLVVPPPQSNTFRPLYRVDNIWKTSGDNTCLFPNLN